MTVTHLTKKIIKSTFKELEQERFIDANVFSLRQIVHGDLAARNILVFKDNVVKITDFGLSKQLYANSEYFIKRQVPA